MRDARQSHLVKNGWRANHLPSSLFRSISRVSRKREFSFYLWWVILVLCSI